MQLVLGRYDYEVTRNSNFSVQTKQSCQEISICGNFKLIMTNLPKFQRKLVYLISPRSFKLFQGMVVKWWTTEHQSCQEPETLSIVYFFQKVVRPL